jgi:hypothetical protein|tara:strand:- start:838 stop:1005 length:168 start_codon:yes stop_codon:yes gene_type:complete
MVNIEKIKSINGDIKLTSFLSSDEIKLNLIRKKSIIKSDIKKRNHFMKIKSVSFL